MLNKDLERRIKRLESKLCCKSTVFYDVDSPQPLVGKENTLYVDTDSGSIFIWDGTVYASVGGGGIGVPTGGTTGQVLAKINNTNYNTQWVNPSSGGGAVDSVNTQTGVVVLDADNIDDSATAHKFVTATDITNLSNLSGTNSGDNAVNTLYSGLVSNATHTGDVTGATTLTITNDAVTNAKAANMAANTIKGRITAGIGDPQDLTAASVRTITETETTTQLNTRDTNNRARANHTGTQTASTISDFDSAVTANSTVTANTAKVSNATHTGEVTGSTILTLDKTAITNRSAATVASGDLILISDVNDSDNLKKVTAQDIADLGGPHTHVKADITDFAHTHVKSDITDFAHTHPQSDITNLTTDLSNKASLVHTHVISDVTGLQTALDGKVDENAAITGATRTKITYDAKGLVTSGANATSDDIGEGITNLYWSNSRTISSVLTGLSVSGSNIVSTDTILQALGKAQNQINSVVGGVSYQGSWNANTNSPTITSSVGTKGHYYVVDVAGATNINSITDWKLGDWIIFNGTIWQKVDNTDAVVTVNGYTGTVTLTTADISDSTNRRYLTDAQLTVVGNTSGTNTGDNATNTQYSGLAASKVDANVAIVAGTGTKVTYDTKGLVTSSTSATTADIADSLNKRYVTDAQLTVIGNTSGTNTGNQTSIVGITGTVAEFNTALTDGDFATGGGTATGTNTGDNAVNSLYSGLVSNATHTGEVTGSTTLTVDPTAISNKSLKSSLAGTEEVLINDAGTLKKTTAQDIADLGGGGGGTLKDGEVPTGTINSSNLIFTLSYTPINPAGVIIVLNGVVQYNGSDYTISGNTITFTTAPVTGSTIYAYNGVTGAILGVAVGDITGLGTGVATALAVNTGNAGAFVTFNGALGTPLSGIATNLTGIASGLTAGNVTTNANLTGVVTSVGNATAIADNALSIAKTSGLQSALDLKANLISPSFTTPSLGIATATSINGATITSGTLNGSVTGTNTGDNAVNSLYSGLVSNATHTGEVTGATGLTLDKTAVTNRSTATVASGDLILIADIDDSNNLKKVSAQDIADLGGGGGGSFTAGAGIEILGTLIKVGEPELMNNQAVQSTTAFNVGGRDYTQLPKVQRNPITGVMTCISRLGAGHVGAGDFGYIILERSLDKGKTWHGINPADDFTQIAVEASIDLRLQNCFYTKTGRLITMFGRYTGTAWTGITQVMYSDDDGVTWSAKTTIPNPSGLLGTVIVNAPYGNKIVYDDNGDILYPFYAVYSSGGAIVLARSQDNGETWDTNYVTAYDDTSYALQEPSIEDFGDGTFLMVCRVAAPNTAGYRIPALLKSTDYGRNWAGVSETLDKADIEAGVGGSGWLYLEGPATNMAISANDSAIPDIDKMYINGIPYILFHYHIRNNTSLINDVRFNLMNFQDYMTGGLAELEDISITLADFPTTGGASQNGGNGSGVVFGNDYYIVTSRQTTAASSGTQILVRIPVKATTIHRLVKVYEALK